MKVFTQKLRSLSLLSAVSALASGAFAQTDTALVPFLVNVSATVSATDGATTMQISVIADEEAVLRLPLQKTSGVLNGTQRQANVPAIISNRSGKVALNLSAESYRNAEVALYTVNGKRVLRGKVSAASDANNISRRNIAPGAYLLSVRGTDGDALTSRITHGGGGLAIDVAFGGKELYASKRLAKEAAVGDWTITVSAEGYVDTVYTLRPAAGTNTRQNITLRPLYNGYEYVVIGGKRWMSKNLNIATADSWCYGNDPDNCAKYGRLYTWQAALTACPAGWHLPTRQEWGDLAIAAGGTGTYGTGGTAGRALKSTSGWNSSNGITNDDSYGFSALPSGGRHPGGSFNDVGYDGYWWTARESSSGYGGYAYYRRMIYTIDFVDEGTYDNSYGISVRCVGD